MRLLLGMLLVLVLSSVAYADQAPTRLYPGTTDYVAVRDCKALDDGRFHYCVEPIQPVPSRDQPGMNVLRASTNQAKTVAYLRWGMLTGWKVRIYRNGKAVALTWNDDAASVRIPAAAGTYQIRVCELVTPTPKCGERAVSK